MTGLDVLRDVLAARQLSGRAIQVESGASNAGECRAASLLRLTGTPKSDPDLDLGLPATWGSGLHLLIEQTIRDTGTDELSAEYRFAYRDVPVTVDCVLERELRVVDWKGIEKGALVDLKRENRCKPNHRMQVHLGAAAVIDAGLDIETVSIVYIPRDGRTLDDCWEFTEPYDQTIADAAVADLAYRDGLVDLLEDGADPVGSLDGLRDEPPGFCHAFCPWVSVCRGQSDADDAFMDDATRQAWEDYDAAKAELDDAKAREAYLKGLLPSGGRPVAIGGWRYAWSRDTRRPELVPDLDAVDVEGYEFVFGPLPRKTVTKGKASQLNRTKVNDK